MKKDYQQDEPIMALATGLVQSAIAVIRTSGKGVIQLLSALFCPSQKLLEASHRKAVYGKLINPKNGEVLDEVVALVYHEGGGYTGEEAVELMCHGSLPGVQMILKVLGENGFRQAAAGEFSFRAFMNGRVDLTQAEAVNELVASKSFFSHKMALGRLSGTLSQKINEVKKLLTKAMAAIEIQLDYPGDEVDDETFFPISEIEEAIDLLKMLLSGYESGRLYREGFRIALCGKTNSGKSSLFNLFLKEDRSIVSDVHGTTRDYLEAWISIKDRPVLLYDTAGLRETPDPIEQEGIRRAREVIESSDLLLYLADSTESFDQEEWEAIKKRSKWVLPIWNKCDLSQKEQKLPIGFFPLSTVTLEGFDLIQEKVLELQNKMIGVQKGGSVGLVIDSLRQKRLLEEAIEALKTVLKGLRESEVFLDGVAVDLQEALNAIGELTGEVSSEEILEEMFSRFCVGK